MTWLYLPNFHSSVVQGGGSLQPNISLDGEQSAMSNGISMQSTCLKQGSGMDISTMPQSGMMPLHSTGAPGLDVWILSLRASRVNHSVPLEGDSPSSTLEMDGLPSSASFARYDPDTHCWRTFQGSLLSPITEEYSATWPKRVSIVNRTASRRRKWVRTIKGTGSGLLLPTPTLSTGSYQRSPGSMKKRYSLMGMAHHNLWPTPTAGDGKNRKRSQKSKVARVGLTLLEKVLFATPGTRGIDSSKHVRAAAKKRGTFIVHNGGKLNPNWVEWLMGWPIGWTDLEPLAMDKFQLWLEKHGEGLEEGNDA